MEGSNCQENGKERLAEECPVDVQCERRPISKVSSPFEHPDMTEVLSAPVPVDRTPYFHSSSSASRLRHSPSSKLGFYVASSDPYTGTFAKGYHLHTEYADKTSHSASSSTLSSPHPSHNDLSQLPSSASTPDSCLSLDIPGPNEEEDQIIFPSYDDAGYLDQPHESDPPTSPTTDATNTVPESDGSSSSSPKASAPSRPDSPEIIVTAEDDTAVHSQPSRHVDYLSHDWKEEDIWASWRHIVSKRKIYGNSVRLENASWRTWAKSKYRLKTVSPETLNWLKDCDVTWLYGPLQTHHSRGRHQCETPAGRYLAKSNSFLNKKPILKKRSMSEIMLQKSLSASSLLKQAAAAIQAQQRGYMSSGNSRRPSISRATSDFVTSSFASRSGSGEGTSGYPSTSSSGLQTPATAERRHIHFNDKVEQCIAVDIVRDGEDEDDDLYNAIDDNDSDSDEGVVMMKVSSKASVKARINSRSTPRNSFSAESKTIAMLPSTTLKYQDSPEPEEPSSGTSNRAWNTRMLSPSPSQETLRPSRPSTNFLLDEEDDDVDMSWEPSGAFAKRTEGTSISQDRVQEESDARDDDREHNGLRRTASGMFMPYDEDDDYNVPPGLFGKVVDTVNTAKDIAHVIWNVGWRR